MDELRDIFGELEGLEPGLIPFGDLTDDKVDFLGDVVTRDLAIVGESFSETDFNDEKVDESRVLACVADDSVAGVVDVLVRTALDEVGFA